MVRATERTGRRFALVRTPTLGDVPTAGHELAEVLEEVRDISREFTPQVLASCVEVTGHDPVPEEGWVLGEAGRFTPREFKPTPLHEMCEALAHGVEVKVGKAIHHVNDAVWPAREEEAHHARLYGNVPDGGLLDAETVMTLHRVVLGWRIAWHRYADGRSASPPPDGPIVVGE